MAENSQQKPVNKISGRKGIFGQGPSNRKKVLTAVCLLMVMILMWTRVFIAKKPASADVAVGDLAAAQAMGASDTGPAAKAPAVRFVELPKIEGRNDVITRDIFSINRAQIISNSEQDSRKVGSIEQEELAGQLQAKLKLEAIGMGDRKQAFINNKLLCEGDKLTVDNGDMKYECVVVRILETEVYIKCQGVEIKLKLANPNEVIDG